MLLAGGLPLVVLLSLLSARVKGFACAGPFVLELELPKEDIDPSEDPVARLITIDSGTCMITAAESLLLLLLLLLIVPVWPLCDSGIG